MNLTLLLPARILSNANGSKVISYGKVFKWTFSTATTGVSCKKHNKILPFVERAIVDINDGAKLLVGGYGLCGIPENIINALLQKGVKDLTIVSNNCGVDNFGLGLLLKEKRIKRLIASFIGQNSELEKKFHAGELEVELTPQGTLAERIRAGGAGIPAFFTPTAVGTLIEEGGVPIKYTPDGNIAIVSEKRQTQQFNGRDYVLEHAITGDFALIKAWKADSFGNLVFRKTARNFNSGMCRAASVTIAEVEEIVDCIDPDNVHIPGIYVDRVFVCEKIEKRIENLTITKEKQVDSALDSSAAVAASDRILKRAALELQNGMYVNLGIGLPTQLLKHISDTSKVIIQSETGLLGVGKYPLKSAVDPEIINADKQTVTEVPGASYCSSEDSFSMIRGGHLNLAVIGAMEVSQYGDLANWIVPGKVAKGIGASMDLASAPGTKVIVVMEHAMKDGQPKIVEVCNLPLTGTKCVSLIITEKAVFTVHPEQGLTLIEVAEGVEIPDILTTTGCNFQVSPDLKPMQQIETTVSVDEPETHEKNIESIFKTKQSA